MTQSSPIVLENIRIAQPCRAEWSAMRGNDQVRFCASCQKNVYNLSAMTREQAVKLIEYKEGELCVQLYRREDGTVLTSDCSIPIAAKPPFKMLALLAVAVSCLLSPLWIQRLSQLPIIGPIISQNLPFGRVKTTFSCGGAAMSS